MATGSEARCLEKWIERSVELLAIARVLMILTAATAAPALCFGAPRRRCARRPAVQGGRQDGFPRRLGRDQPSVASTCPAGPARLRPPKHVPRTAPGQARSRVFHVRPKPDHDIRIRSAAATRWNSSRVRSSHQEHDGQQPSPILLRPLAVRHQRRWINGALRRHGSDGQATSATLRPHQRALQQIGQVDDLRLPSNQIRIGRQTAEHLVHDAGGRGKIRQESIYLYKAMLVAITRAFDLKAIDKLLFLEACKKDFLVVSGDGLLHFGRLVAAGLASVVQKANKNWQVVTYTMNISDKGRQLILAWKAGDRTKLKRVMGGPIPGQLP
jgi:hypothetical protein